MNFVFKTRAQNVVVNCVQRVDVVTIVTNPKRKRTKHRGGSMSSKKTIEFKRLMGFRQADSDGFTYSYGHYPFNATNGHRDIVKRCIRNDKRSVKARELRRVRSEEQE